MSVFPSVPASPGVCQARAYRGASSPPSTSTFPWAGWCSAASAASGASPRTGRPTAAHVDREPRARLGLGGGEMRHPDRAIHRRRHGAAAHDVYLGAVQVRAEAVPGGDLRLGHLETHEPALPTRELLLLQRREP